MSSTDDDAEDGMTMEHFRANEAYFASLKGKKVADVVNRPAHYTAGEIECIDAIRAAMTPEEFKGYLRGNCFKYLWRHDRKGGVEDLKKAGWYLAKLTEAVG